MKNIKGILILICILLFSLSIINSVSALDDQLVSDVELGDSQEIGLADNSGSDLYSNEMDVNFKESDVNELNDENLDIDSTNQNIDKNALSDSNTKSLSDLSVLINGSGNQVNLSEDFKYKSGDNKSGILINKDLVINGNGYTIDGANSSRIFNISGSCTLTLNNLNIVNANSEYCGGAIYSLGNIIANNVSFRGNNIAGGEYVHYFSQYDYYYGGAIFSKGESSFTNCSFIENIAESGGAVYSNGSCSFIDCTFSKNIASGGLDYDLSCYGSNFYVGAEGASVYSENDVLFRNCNFTENFADLKEAKGPAVIYLNAHNVVENCSFTHNNADAVIYWFGNGTIVDSSFINNSAHDCGGAIFLAGNATISTCDFINNTGANYGGAIYCMGDNVFNLSTYEYKLMPSNISISDCNFIDNYAYFQGGAIYIITDLTVSNCNFTDNYVDVQGFIDVNPYYDYWDLTDAGNGGAIYMENGTVDNCSFIRNSATLNGGAIYSNGSANVLNSNFSENVGVKGSSIFNRVNLTLFNNIVSEDYATIYNDNYYCNAFIKSQVYLVILDNKTYYKKSIDGETIYAKLTDDNGNLIEDIEASLNINTINLVMNFNNETGLFEYTVIRVYGDSLLTGDYYGSTNLTVKSSVINLGIIPTVLNYTIDDRALDDVYLNLDLYGLDGTYLSETVNINIVNDEESTTYSFNLSLLLDEGKTQLKLPNIPRGNFNISLSFEGNDDYASAILYDNFSLLKTDDPLMISVDNITSGQTANIKINLGQLNDFVNVFISGRESQSVELINGFGELNISDLAPGNYTVIVTFAGNDYYNPIWNFTDFAVNYKALIKTNLAIEINDTIYGEDAILNIDLKDELGNGLNKTIVIRLLGESYDFNLTDGKLSVSIKNLTARFYSVLVQFQGDYEFEESYAIDDFMVSRLSTVIEYNDMNTTTVNSDIDGAIGENFTVCLKDSNGKALANKQVLFGFNGKIYEKTCDENGFAKLQINLKRADIYTFAVSFLGDNNYDAQFVVAKITVKKQSLKLTVPNKSYKASAKTKSLTATLKSAKGNPISGKTITFTVNGKSYSAKTDSKGVATVNVSLSTKKTYSFTVKYAGDNTYSAVSKSAKLTIN